jgi:hypothetical protein
MAIRRRQRGTVEVTAVTVGYEQQVSDPGPGQTCRVAPASSCNATQNLEVNHSQPGPGNGADLLPSPR